MPEFAIRIRIKSGKRTSFEVVPDGWGEKDVFIPNLEKPLTTINIEKWLCSQLEDKITELGGEVKRQKL